MALFLAHDKGIGAPKDESLQITDHDYVGDLPLRLIFPENSQVSGKIAFCTQAGIESPHRELSRVKKA